MSDRKPALLSSELETRITTVEQAAMDDPGVTPRDWLALGATAIAIPATLIWLGWSN